MSIISRRNNRISITHENIRVHVSDIRHCPNDEFDSMWLLERFIQVLCCRRYSDPELCYIIHQLKHYHGYYAQLIQINNSRFQSYYNITHNNSQSLNNADEVVTLIPNRQRMDWCWNRMTQEFFNDSIRSRQHLNPYPSPPDFPLDFASKFRESNREQSSISKYNNIFDDIRIPPWQERWNDIASQVPPRPIFSETYFDFGRIIDEVTVTIGEGDDSTTISHRYLGSGIYEINGNLINTTPPPHRLTRGDLVQALLSNLHIQQEYEEIRIRRLRQLDGPPITLNDSQSRFISMPEDNTIFNFQEDQTLQIDLETHGFEWLCDQIKNNRGTEFSFEIIDGDNFAYGAGATRQVFMKMLNEIIETLMIKTHPYFVDIDPDNLFWTDEDNVECFVVAIAMSINSGCLIPYHFSPALLECITNKQLSFSDLEFYMKKIDPDTFKTVSLLDSSDFESLDLGYDDVEDYYRSRVIGNISEQTSMIHQTIAKKFELFDSFNDYEIIDIDDKLSGCYKITPESVIKNMKLSDKKYKKIWDEFINSLTQNEIRQMLLLFGNTLYMNDPYYIHTDKNTSLDINISTCLKTVTINETFFESIEKLDKLRSYFTDNDQIMD